MGDLRKRPIELTVAVGIETEVGMTLTGFGMDGYLVRSIVSVDKNGFATCFTASKPTLLERLKIATQWARLAIRRKAKTIGEWIKRYLPSCRA